MKAETKMIVAAAVVAALCLTAVTSVTQSWFSDEEHATVDVTTGKVDIRAEAGEISLYSLGLEVSDRFTNGGTAALGYSAADGITVTASDMTPGDRFDFLMSVYNLSTVSTLYRMVCTVSGENSSEFSISVGGAAITGYFSTEWALQAATDGGERLIEAVAVSVELPVEATQSATLSMTLRAEAVQSNASTDIVGISNAAELRAFAAEVNCGNTCEGKTVKLLADIDLENEDWTPIGTNADSGNKFKGVFDGQRHTISNLKITQTENLYRASGLFGALNGTVKDLVVDGAKIDARSGPAEGRDSTDNGIAVVAGSVYNYGTIENVTVLNADVTGNRYTGGIAGYVYGNIVGCTVKNSSISAVPDNFTGVYDNGDKVGGIAGYVGEGSNSVRDCSAVGVTVKAYRDVGGIVGATYGDVTGCTAKNVKVIANQLGYANKNVNSGSVVGRHLSGTVDDNSVAGTQTFEYIGCVPNGTVVLGEGISVAVKSVDSTSGMTVSGSGKLVLDNVVIAASSGSALTLEDGSDIVLKIVGTCSLTGAAGGNGITVPETSEITITGDTLTAVGNGGYEYSGIAESAYISTVSERYGNTDDSSYLDKYGSGIGNAFSTTGTIIVSDMASLTVEGYGSRAYGIGGDGSSVTIKGSTVEYARGGFAQSKFLCDANYGKSEAEGAPGIGGLNITISDSVIKGVDGGSKAAGIGAKYHDPTTIVVKDSVLGTESTSINGGNASAGIGGSRQNEIASEDYVDQPISVTIENSRVKANGGIFGAGIGSGYDTRCQSGQPTCTVVITGDSVIVAKGGDRAAGIGTGFHFAALAGHISDTVNVDGVHSGTKFYKSNGNYTLAQDVGYGVVDMSREMRGLTPVFEVGGSVIASPPIAKASDSGL